MGGAKKPSPAKQEKSQARDSKKTKKDKTETGPKKAEITVIVDEPQAAKFIQGTKVITAHGLARHTGIKISAANAFLQESETKGTIKKVAGYSGHYVYQSA